MQDRKKRLMWTVLAVLLPGPWTPVIVLAYLLGRAVDEDHDSGQHRAVAPNCPPDPYACIPAPVSALTTGNPYAPPQPSRSR